MSRDRLLVAKEARQDLGAAQRELERAQQADTLAIAYECIARARKQIAEAMRRLG